MRRGTRVGQAYVAITADGSGINDDIADSFDDVDFKAIGNEHGRAYTDRLREHIKGLDKDFSGLTDKIGNRLSSRLAKAVATDDALDGAVASMISKAFDGNKLDTLIKHVGRKAGVTFGSGFDDVVAAEVLSSLEASLQKVARDADFDMGAIMRGMQSGSGAGQIELFGPMLDDAVRNVQTAHKKMEADLERSMRERAKQEALGERIMQGIRDDYQKQWEQMLAKQDRIREAAVKQRIRQEARGDRIVYAMQQAAAKKAVKLVADRVKQEARGDRIVYAMQQSAIKMLTTAHSMNKRFDADRIKMLNVAHRMNEQFNAARLKEIHEAHRLNTKFDNDRINALQRLGRMQEQALRMNQKFSEGRLDGSGQSVSRNDTDISAKVGKAFGAGSRNNALNLTGRTVGSLTGLIFKATSAATGMFSTFKTGFSQAAAGASMMEKLMSGLGASGAAAGTKMGGAFTRLAASGPLLIAALAAVAVALTIVVTIASALLAIVVALAATIASALVGAMAVGIGALGAFGVAAGLATMAFTSMTNKQRESFRVFESLHAMSAGLGQIMIRQMIPAFKTWAENLQVALALIKPLAEVMGGAFARAGTILTASLSGPGIQMFITALGQTLPRIVTNLSRAFGGFLNGVSGVFAALMPFVLRFSDYLANVATDFAKWATSAKGQNSISDFVDRALGALKSLWGFIKAVGSLVSEVLFSKSGQNAGNTIFDDMAGAVRRFVKYLSKEDRLENWFKDGQKFAKALGKAIKTVARILEDMNNSKVIDVIAKIATIGETAYNWWSKLPSAITNTIGPIETLLGPVAALADMYERLVGLQAAAANAPAPTPLADMFTETSIVFGGGEVYGPAIPKGALGGGGKSAIQKTIDDLIADGTKALNTTYEMHGGHMPDPVDPSGSGSGSGSGKPKFKGKLGPAETEWVNTYIAWANSLVSKSARVADEIRAAAKEARGVINDALSDVLDMFMDLLIDFNESFAEGIASAAQSTDMSAVVDSFNNLIEQASEGAAAAVDSAYASAADTMNTAQAAGDAMIATAQSAFDSAAQGVASASNPKELKAALKVLDQARMDLALARIKANELKENALAAADSMILAANTTAEGVNAANTILAGQQVLTWQNVDNLVNGMKVEGATLTDYAEARRQIAEKLADATQQLVTAIATRDNYANAVADSIRTFGSLMSAQAKSINGVEQALTATDITSNLQDRLAKIRKFAESLRQLRAMGLSDAAYKQIVDAGVDGGSAYADAILAGGQGAVSEVNNLTGQIDTEAFGLGDAAASQMYQAGVDAAQGLVDGLLSLSAELDSAATALGVAITDAIKRELGIASPSKVAYGLMFDDVGDGMVNGLDAAQNKVGTAGARLAGQVAVSPEVAAYAGRQGASATVDAAVSGNGTDPRFRDLIIHTPTEDPHAVAMETLNEVTGRL